MADELDVTTIKHMTHGYKDRTLVVFSICYPVAVVAVALRFLSRSMVKNGYWWDDWLAVIALVSIGTIPANTKD